MAKAVVLSAVRTPIGRYGGALAGVRPDDLAALAIREAVARAGVPTEQIEDVWFGAANQAGEDNRNVARMAALLAGLPESVGGRRRSTACAGRAWRRSSAPCHAVIAGDGDLFVAGGEESMSTRAVRDAEGREAVRARRPAALRHDARLALHEPEARGAVPAGVDGRDGRERRRAVGRVARGPGRVRARVAATLGGRRRGGPLRRRARRRCGDVDARRASAPRHDAREARGAQAGVPRGRHGDGRQRVGHQRRRRGTRDRVGGEGARARRRAARRVRRQRGRGRRPARDGHRPDPGGAQAARARRRRGRARSTSSS